VANKWVIYNMVLRYAVINIFYILFLFGDSDKTFCLIVCHTSDKIISILFKVFIY
jgi:hypothetical protein